MPYSKTLTRAKPLATRHFRKCVPTSAVRPQVEAGNQGKIVAIDIDTGAFEVADDVLTASDRRLARYPDAQTWFVRIGHRAVHRFGPRAIPETV